MYKELPCSKLLLQSTGDWCGGLDALCEGCAKWKGTPGSFRKAARHMWTKRAIEVRGKERRPL